MPAAAAIAPENCRLPNSRRSITGSARRGSQAISAASAAALAANSAAVCGEDHPAAGPSIIA